ncbi:uncharacterized protein LOC122566844 [Bombus pyrosoma]|uniref:uncharacterized protein LOC122566844 n=1 Tax=Bombus pyrosoma TaxID=396416 RepID=UPI001CB89C75|nr:uncharacterized protein LOC122566844 [Bombus pyrosoma]
MFWYQINVVTELMEHMKYDWKMNQGEPLKILKKYAVLGKRYSVVLIALIYLGAFIPITCHMFSYILCIIVSTNITCQHKFPMTMEYFVDKKKYSFFITSHQYFLLIVNATILAGIETLMVTWFQHACSLFAVVSYHIKKAVFEDCVQSHVSRRYLNRNSKRNIENVINAHRRAMEYAYNLRDRYMFSYGTFLLFVTICLSINFFLLAQSTFLYRNIEESFIHLVFLSCMLTCMVFFNYMIQLTSDAADNIVTIIYDTNWYEASVPLQKLLLIIMIRSIDSFTCSFFGFYNASMGGVSMILKKSVSYFTVMMSMK